MREQGPQERAGRAQAAAAGQRQLGRAASAAHPCHLPAQRGGALLLPSMTGLAGQSDTYRLILGSTAAL